ncbi:MAG: hypothetical protein IPN34_20070 [Planctomycetes bacterium]|nr:hypothetical protein [Planctomycetota bacterium]
MLASLALSFALLACAQEPARPPTAAEVLAPWQGQWRGELELWQRDGVARRVPMELHVQPVSASEWTWTIVYGAPSDRQERRYALRAKDGGALEIDERNGIVLPLQRFAQRFFSRFSVGTSELLARYELVGEGELLYEMISAGGAEAGKTGGAGETPEVVTAPVCGFQRALLRRAAERSPQPEARPSTGEPPAKKG